MPMLKTVAAGKTSVTAVRDYLEKPARQDRDLREREIGLFEEGALQLSEGQVGRIRGYLEGGSRALAVDVSEGLSKRHWAAQMRATCAQYGHDRPTKTGTPRLYYHFVLSPGIDEDCDLESLRAYAVTWAEENLRSGGRMHEYAIVYHDDNENGVMHAHIVANVTNTVTGKKLHISNDEVVRLGNSAQEIGGRFGFGPVRGDVDYEYVGVRTSQPVYMGREERELLNKGMYSWKWELRQVIAETAAISCDYEDFRRRLRQRGYGVERAERRVADKSAGSSGRSTKVAYEYLLYTHKNGRTVRDEKLGSRFYLEALEREFGRGLEGRSYTAWELAKISKGEVPWKEDIRRAVDQITPTVLTVPELQGELERLFGIKVIVNRRGITYQHPCGYKARDASLGMRYTQEGMRQGVVMSPEPSRPTFDDVLAAGSTLAGSYVQQCSGSASADVGRRVAESALYGEFTKFMRRNGLARIDAIPELLEQRRLALLKDKEEMANLGRELMKWNRLAALQDRFEEKGDTIGSWNVAGGFLDDDFSRSRMDLLSEYLAEQTGGEDPRRRRDILRAEREDLLNRHQESLDFLAKDRSVYECFMAHCGEKALLEAASPISGGVSPQALLSAARTLSKHGVSDFNDLVSRVRKEDSRLSSAEVGLRRAEKRRDELRLILSDIRSLLEEKACQEAGGPLLGYSELVLGDVASLQRFRNAAERLSAKGLSIDDYETQRDLCEQADLECSECGRRRDGAARVRDELARAHLVCLEIAGRAPHQYEQMTARAVNGASSGTGGAAVAMDDAPRVGRRQGLEPSPISILRQRRAQTVEEPGSQVAPATQRSLRDRERHR